MTDAAAAPLAATAAALWGRARTLAHETWKYFLVSLLALAVDFGLLVALTEFARMHYLLSAAVGFSAGLVVNYLLSVTLVFAERRLSDRRLEFIGFFAIGLAGLALNEGLLRTFVENLGLAYALAKVPAAAIGFVFSFVSRRLALFTTGG